MTVMGNEQRTNLKRGYNTNDLVYGLAAYMGVDGVLLYTKYDLNPLFLRMPRSNSETFLLGCVLTSIKKRTYPIV